MPLYRITDTLTGQDYGYEAENPAQAVRAITADRFAVKPMTATEAIQLARAGVEIVLATDRDAKDAAAAPEPIQPVMLPEPEVPAEAYATCQAVPQLA